jgi:biotin operon repressor
MEHVSPTERQKEMLNHIRMWAINHGCWPCGRDLAPLMNISRNAVYVMMRSLMRRGLIFKHGREVRLRGYRLTLSEDRGPKPDRHPIPVQIIR